MCSVSAYIVPTYLIPGLAVVYGRLAATAPPLAKPRLASVQRLAVVSLIFLAIAQI